MLLKLGTWGAELHWHLCPLRLELGRISWDCYTLTLLKSIYSVSFVTTLNSFLKRMRRLIYLNKNNNCKFKFDHWPAVLQVWSTSICFTAISTFVLPQPLICLDRCATICFLIHMSDAIQLLIFLSSNRDDIAFGVSPRKKV